MRAYRSSALLGHLIGITLILLGESDCRRQETPPKQPAAAETPGPGPAVPPAPAGAKNPAAASPQPAAVAPNSAEIGRKLTVVRPEPVPGTPDYVDVKGRFFASHRRAGCDLWDLNKKVYFGSIPDERCGKVGWLKVPSISEIKSLDEGDGEKAGAHQADKKKEPAEEHTQYSPDGKRLLRWQGSSLFIDPAGSHAEANAAPVEAGCSKKSCPEVIAVAGSPDSQKVAFARKGGTKIFILDAESGKEVKTLRLEKGERALRGMVAWGPNGLIALVGTVETVEHGDSEEDSRTLDITLVGWPALDAKRKEFRYSASSGYSDADERSISLDPLGRYIFEEQSEFRVGGNFSVFTIGGPNADWMERKRADTSNCGGTEITEGRWTTGEWPVMETIETDEPECEPSYTAYRLDTAPGKRHIDPVSLRKPPRSARRAGKNEDLTIDASKRWQSTGMNSVRRLSDNVELTLADKHCAYTDSGVFDCPLSTFAKWNFLLGTDPLQDEVAPGIHYAHLFYHPGLIDDFFDGKPVDPDPLAQGRGKIGAPPRLDKVAVRYLDKQVPSLEVTLLAHDGGDGVGGLRTWFAGRPLKADLPALLPVEQPTPLGLSLPETLCGRLQILACNRQGGACSKPVDVPYCPKKKNRIK